MVLNLPTPAKLFYLTKEFYTNTTLTKEEHLKARVIELEASETKLKQHKAKLVAFSTRCLVHFGGCGGGCPRVDKSRENLQSEYDTLMEEVNS